MAIRCRAEHHRLGILLSRIQSLEDATSLRCYFAERGIGAALPDPGGEHDFRLVLVGLSLDEFNNRVAGSNIELLD